MIMVESLVEAADNSGGIFFKCIRVFGGFNRKYAGLGELIGVVSSTRKKYKKVSNKIKMAKLAKKVKKKKKNKEQKKKKTKT